MKLTSQHSQHGRPSGLFVFAAAMLAAAFFLLPGQASAQDAKAYPSRVVRVVIGYPPAGAVDIMGRIMAARLSEALGQQFIVENRPGASQNIAAELVARATPDGYTLLHTSSALGINATLYPKLNYHPVKSFAPVAVFSQAPNLLVVHPSLPVITVRDFIALAKKNPGKLNFAAPVGTTQHLSGELLKLLTGVQMTHIPYKGSAPALTALISGEVDFAFNNITSVHPLLQQNRLKALAVTSKNRSLVLPNVATMIESGVKDFEVAAWYGYLAPAGTPPAVVTKLNATIQSIAGSSDFKQQMAKLGADAIVQSPQYFSDFLEQEIVRWQAAVKASGAKPD
jgi:tripartite-type tricarboxylate transporter receptor subunit TctC